MLRTIAALGRHRRAGRSPLAQPGDRRRCAGSGLRTAAPGRRRRRPMARSAHRTRPGFLVRRLAGTLHARRPGAQQRCRPAASVGRPDPRRTRRSTGPPRSPARCPKAVTETLMLGPVGPSDLSRILRRVLGWAPAWPRVRADRGALRRAIRCTLWSSPAPSVRSGRTTVWRGPFPTASWSSPDRGSPGSRTGCVTLSSWPRSRETRGWTCSGIWTPRLSTSGTHSRSRPARES